MFRAERMVDEFDSGYSTQSVYLITYHIIIM